MKLEKIGVAVLSFTLFLGTYSFAQNSNVVSAALAYKNYMPNMGKGDFEAAKKSLVEAKTLIDKAMKNEDTKNDEKANYYNAMINYSLIELASTGKFADLKPYTNGDSILAVIQTSAKKTEPSNRWNGELQDFFKRKIGQTVRVGSMMYKKKKYKFAYAGFLGAYKLKEMAGLDKNLEEMKQNAIISARHYIDTLKKQKKTDEALAFVSEVLEFSPGNAALAIEGVNLALKKDDLKQAEDYFHVAAKASPKNKELFSNMGSIFLSQADKKYQALQELKPTDSTYKEKAAHVEDLYKKAETNLKKALEIDPNYADAAYNLGVLYLGRGEKLKTKANNLELNDPRYNTMLDKSKELYKQAIPPLEIYIKSDPNNASVLRVLYQVYRGVGNNEKALEYRKKYEAASAASK